MIANHSSISGPQLTVFDTGDHFLHLKELSSFAVIKVWIIVQQINNHSPHPSTVGWICSPTPTPCGFCSSLAPAPIQFAQVPVPGACTLVSLLQCGSQARILHEQDSETQEGAGQRPGLRSDPGEAGGWGGNEGVGLPCRGPENACDDPQGSKSST